MQKIVLRDKWGLSRTYELHEPITMHNGDSGHVFHLEYVQDGEQGECQHVHVKVGQGSLSADLLAEAYQALLVAREYINVRAEFAPIVWRVKGLGTAFEQGIEEETKDE